MFVFFTILFTSTTLGYEQSQKGIDAFGRELREAERKPVNVAKKYKKKSGWKKSSKKGNMKKKIERRVKKLTKRKMLRKKEKTIKTKEGNPRKGNLSL